MNRGIIAAAVFTVMLLICFSGHANAQDVSENDTLKIENAFGNAGDTIPIRMYLANTIDVGGLNFLLHFDSTNLAPAYDWFNIMAGDTASPLHYEMIERGYNFVDDTTKFLFTNFVNSIDTSATLGHIVTGVFVGDPFDPFDDISIGSGVFLEFYVYIKPTAPQGTTIDITLYDETDPESSLRQNEFYDPQGLVGIRPTLVSGIVTVGEGPGPGENHSPYFTQPSQTTYNLEQGESVQFTVAATDPDAGQPLTLTMLSGPSGASFNDVSGNGNASSVFTWTPTYTQVGAFSAIFEVEDDSAATAQRSVTFNVATTPVEEDFLFTRSQENFFVEGGIPGANDAAVPVNLNDLNTLYGIQFDITYDYNVLTLDSVSPTDRIPDFEIYTDEPGEGLFKVVSFGLANEHIGDPVSTDAIFLCWFSIDPAALPGHYKFKLDNAWASVDPDPNVGSVPITVDTTGAVAVDAIGDVNLDTHTNVDDVVKVVAFIIGDHTLTTRQFRTADVDINADVNVVDLVAIINLIFTGSQPTSIPKFEFIGPPAFVDVVTPEIGSDGVSISADLPADIAGFQFDVIYDPYEIELGDPELTVLTDGLRIRHSQIAEGQMRVLAYVDPSDIDNIVRAGSVDLINLPVHGGFDFSGESPVAIRDVVLSTPDAQQIPVAEKHVALPYTFRLAQNYPNPFNPSTHISFSIEGNTAQHVVLSIFNVLGQEVTRLLESELIPGEYDVIWNGTSDDGRMQASGIYFYSLQVGEARETKKMVLSK